MKKQVLTLLAVAAILASCGGNQESKDSSTESTTTPAQTETSTTAGTEQAGAVVSNTVEITANDQMKFSVTEIRVKAGEEVTVTLKNEGTMAKEAMGHNFVLLTPGTNVEEFAQTAMNNKANDYIPESLKSAIVAHTKLLGPNESDTITFTVEKGEYEFICSFPGHYGSMRGKLIAE
jgi:azurin